MRKKILGFVFAAALLAAMAVPLFGSGGTALAADNAVRLSVGTASICFTVNHNAGAPHGAGINDAAGNASGINGMTVSHLNPGDPCP